MAIDLPLTLPYFAAPDRLPGPLPSVADIDAASEQLATKRSDRSLVRIGPYVIKYGKYLAPIEAENMIFVRQACDLSVPEVYAVFKDNETKMTYIIMEFISGRPLDSLWKSLDDRAKEEIISLLRDQMNALRQIPSQGYYGQLGNLPYYDEIFSSMDEEAQVRICGPFETEQQLVEGIVQSYLANCPGSHRAYYLQRVLPAILHNHHPVFTHGDLQRKNIIVSSDGRTPFIIDWERAAWYPDCWEYYRTIVSFGRYEDDWHKWIGQFLTEYVHELAWLQLLHFELLC